MEDIQKDFLPDLNLNVDEHVKTQFSEAAKWARFVSVTMFVLAGLVLVFGLIGTSMLAGTMERLGGNMYGDLLNMSGGVIVLIVVLISIAIGTVYYFLYSFSVKIKKSIYSDNPEEFTGALKMLKIFFIITTIVAILGLLSDIIKLF